VVLFTPSQERNMFENKVPPMPGNLISDGLSAGEILLSRLPLSLSLSLSLFFYLSVETREYGFSHRGNVGAPLAFSWLRLERISRTFELPHVRAI